MGDIINSGFTAALAPASVAPGSDLVEVIDVSVRDAAGSTDSGRRKMTVAELQAAANQPTDYSASGALAIRAGVATISKTGSLAAMTLAAPTAAQEGVLMTITSRSAFAHTVTATTLIEDGVTGGAKTTATFAAFPGATMQLLAVNQKWHTVSLKAVTIS